MNDKIESVRAEFMAIIDKQRCENGLPAAAIVGVLEVVKAEILTEVV